MPVCPKCHKEYSSSAVQCPDCGAHLARFGAEHDLRLVSVYSAEEEMAARLVHGALVNNGVPAYIHSEQAAMFGSILEMDRGCWGEVMVPEPYQDRALEIIQAYTTESSETEQEAEELAISSPSPDD